MTFNLNAPGVLSYGFAAMVFLGVGIYLTGGARGSGRGRLLIGAVFIGVPTAIAAAGWIATQHPAWWGAYRVLEAARIGIWLLFLAALLSAGPTLKSDLKLDPNLKLGADPVADQDSGAGPSALTRFGTLLLLALAALLPSAPPTDGVTIAAVSSTSRLAYGLLLAVTIIGLMAVETLVRTGNEESRWRLKPLMLGVGGAFAFDLFLYADTVLFAQLDEGLWIARSLVQVLVMPFVVLAAARNKDWTLSIAVSRGVVFHSTALVGAGLYLLAIAAAGYYVRQFGGTWGKLLQTSFLFGALLIFMFLMLSGRLRARLRVFVSKNFYAYRYDYRNEWLRVTNLLATRGEASTLNDRVIRALADLVESPGGSVWLRRDRSFYQAARWNVPRIEATEPIDGALARFLAIKGWVIDRVELTRDAALYEELTLPQWLDDDDQAWLVIPLVSLDDLVGFVVLTRPRTPIEVNWEVRDLLKTSGRQAASSLAQIHAAEALLEAGKFDAFNRMSAFVVHDLKNLVAQLSLLHKNAERHKANPEFQEDMLLTIRHVTDRMTGLLGQLRAGTAPVTNPGPVDLVALIDRIKRQRINQSPSVTFASSEPCVVLGHADRLERVIGHVVQNAQDATRGDAAVSVRISCDDECAVVEVRDAGIGMSVEFIRERLFKPFQTTKSAGMGIGAYESAQYVAELGGRIDVHSVIDEGTTMRVVLPLAHRRHDIALVDPVHGATA